MPDWLWAILFTIGVLLFAFSINIVMGFVEWRERRIDKKKDAKRKLINRAAEYDRLRDEEFRELGWTGKY